MKTRQTPLDLPNPNADASSQGGSIRSSHSNPGTRRAIAWSALEAAGSGLLSLAGAFLIARLIGPNELGIGAAAVAVNVLLWVAVNALFADAIVQRATLDDADLASADLASAAWASAATGCAAAAVQAASGWLLAWLLNDARLVPMSLALALPLPFVGLGGALQGMLTRRRRYGILAARTLTGQGAGTLLGVTIALPHPRAWAPVAQQSTACLIAALVLIGATGWRPTRSFAWPVTRDLLRLGLPLIASTLVQIGRYRIFVLMIGGTAGPDALGQIHVAFRLVDTCRDTGFTALWRLFLPILARHQHDRAALLAQVDRLLWFSCLAAMPLCGGLAVALVPVTSLVLGPEWRDAGAAALPLVALMALLVLMLPSGVALIAVGGARHTLFANLAGLAVTVVIVLVLRPASPWDAVLAWCGAQMFVSPYSLWVNGRALGAGPFRPLRAGLPMAVAACPGALLAMCLEPGGTPYHALWRMGGFMAVTAAAGIPAAFMWRPGRAAKPTPPIRTNDSMAAAPRETNATRI